MLTHDKFSYQNGNSAPLSRKVRVVQHIASRAFTKEKSAGLIETIKNAKLPHDVYQTTTIINTDGAVPGRAMLCAAASKAMKRYPCQLKPSWALAAENSARVPDKQERAPFAKDGGLISREVQQVRGLPQQWFSKQRL